MSDYFQVRISQTCATYFQEIKNIYEKEQGEVMTQGAIISRVVDEVSALNQWNQVIESNPLKIENNIKLTENNLRIRAKISPIVEESINNYKYYLMPRFTGTRSVTLGVTLTYLFKAVLLIRKNPKLVAFNRLKDFESIILSYESRMKEFVAPANIPAFNDMWKELTVDLKRISVDNSEEQKKN